MRLRTGSLSKYMRILIFFDLPVKEKEDKHNYNHFRKFLINDGYHMMQYSIYYRICNGSEMVEKHLKRLRMNLPSKGSVRALSVTERQFERMEILVGKPSKQEKDVNCEQLMLF